MKNIISAIKASRRNPEYEIVWIIVDTLLVASYFLLMVLQPILGILPTALIFVLLIKTSNNQNGE